MSMKSLEQTILEQIEQGDLLRIMSQVVEIVEDDIKDGKNKELLKGIENRLKYLDQNYELKRKTDNA